LTPPPTIMSAVFDSAWFRSPLRRRLTFALCALILAALCLWPRQYAAETELLPQTSGGGLSAILAQQAGGAILDLGSLTGNRQTIEADLTVARSYSVLRTVIVKLLPAFPSRFRDPVKAAAKLRHELGIIAIRGSILQITVRDHDPAFAKALVNAVATSIQDRLAALSIQQAGQKRAVAENRLREASLRLFNAQQALTQFRLANKLAAPEAQLGAGVSELAALQGQLQAKQVELTGLQEVATPNNVQIKVIQTEIGSIKRQIAEIQTTSRGESSLNLAGLSLTNSAYFNLYRDEKTADILYQVYTRYMEELTIDEMSANENMDIIDPAYINPERQFNIWAVGLLIVVLILAVMAEGYVLRPPVGRR